MDGLFYDCGGKLQTLSKVLFVILSICSIFYGISIFDDWGYRWLISIILIIGGPLLAFVQSLLLYSFGQLVDDIAATRRMQEQQTQKN